MGRRQSDAGYHDCGGGQGHQAIARTRWERAVHLLSVFAGDASDRNDVLCANATGSPAFGKWAAGRGTTPGCKLARLRNEDVRTSGERGPIRGANGRGAIG